MGGTFFAGGYGGNRYYIAATHPGNTRNDSMLSGTEPRQ